MAVSSILSFFFSFSILVATRHLAPANGQCLASQKKLLLELKSEFKVNTSESLYNHLMRWNQTDDDCCQWGGVECDGAGRVISLSLGNEAISGRIGESSSLFRLTYLSELDLSFNDFTTTQIPNQFHRLPNLRALDLSRSGFMGPIPSTLANLTELVRLKLSGNSLTGLSPSFHLCNKLEVINIGDNDLRGSLYDLHLEGLRNLSFLDLHHNSFNGSIPHHLFHLPSIEILLLSDSQFSGRITELPIVNHSKLSWLDLSGNRIQGHVPNFLFQLQSLRFLFLSNNLFDGTLKLQKIQGLPRLKKLDLSYNNLAIETTNMNSSSFGFPQLIELRLSSCKLYDFPDLRNQSSLSDLDLSNNSIGGEIPTWIWETDLEYLNLSHNLLTDLQKPYSLSVSLYVLDLRSNQLRSEFLLLPQANHSNQRISSFLLANNNLTGVIPTSICNASYQFRVLDLSFNNLSGSIPPCLIKKTLVLQALSLRGNNITGVIPDQFSSECGLMSFDVSDNNLGGKIPKSLGNCKGLKVMNVGNNNFDDSFPCMLPSSLQVLVLRSNRFHGDLTCHQSWPNLQILDMSSNKFSGTLDPLNLSSLRGMMLQNPAHLSSNLLHFEFLGDGYYYRNEVTLTVKGVEVKLVMIWPDFKSIDLSCNYFEGEIPDAIGDLTSLSLLNLSHNALSSAIPKSLGALTKLGSLDLSANQLRGRIPEELAQLRFLSFLNVSHNHLTGKIPTDSQFQTFSQDIFEGNTGLCGFPLNKSCSHNTHGVGSTPSKSGIGSTPSKSKNEEIEWEYVFAALGYVVGLGSIAWTLLLCRRFREIYFGKIEEVVEQIFERRDMRRRRERIRRRVGRRNEVIRRHHQ